MKMCAVVLLSVLYLLQVAHTIPLPPSRLLCEGNPVGLSTRQLADLPRQLLFATDSPRPEFSWTVLHSDRGAVFSAFRMIVASDQNLAHVWWDSGAVWGESASVRYGGRPLESSRVYYWKAVWKGRRRRVV